MKYDTLFFYVDPSPESGEEAASLAADLILAGALISDAGGQEDWKLEAIDVIYPLESETCGLELYVKNNDVISHIAEGKVSVYDVMESFICEADHSVPTQSSTIEVLLCKDTAKMAGSGVVTCMIPRAYCSYQPTTSGEPTYCNDAPYPNNDFTLIVWGFDWSMADGECLIVEGNVSIYKGKPQIVFEADEANILPCK